MTNLPVFEPRTRARRNDPITSHMAAHEVGDLASSHHRAILDFLDGIYPMAANYEDIAKATKIEKHAIARRLKELHPALIEKAGQTILSSGRAGMAWRRKS